MCTLYTGKEVENGGGPQFLGMKKAADVAAFFNAVVPRAGLEPARPNGHMALNHACLPISAPGLVTPLGLEPRTLSLKVRCSNQLS